MSLSLLTPSSPRRAPSLLRRVGLAAAVAAASFAVASPAQAALTDISFDVSVYPADAGSDGVTPPDPAIPERTGSYSGDVSVDYGAAPGPTRTKVQQLRAGTVLPPRYDSDADKYNPVSVLPGDVFRVIDQDTGAVLAETAFNGNPSINSSVLGQTAVSGLINPGTTYVGVGVSRRVARDRRTTWVTGAFQWIVRAKALPTDSEWDTTAAKYFSSTNKDVIPEYPLDVLPAGQQYYLQTVTPGYWGTRPTLAHESVGIGKITSVTDTTFSGVYSTPLVAGDYVGVTAQTESLVGDVRTTITTNVTAPAGAIPPRDAVAPRLVGVLFGAKSTTYSRFTKAGLRTFVTMDEPGTVVQRIQYTPKSKKKSKPKKPKVIGTGSATVLAAGQTVQVDIKADRKGKKNLKAFRKLKKGKLTLATTITDLAGNVTYAEQKIKLKK